MSASLHSTAQNSSQSYLDAPSRHATQDLVSTAWGFARLGHFDAPLVPPYHGIDQHSMA